MNKKNIIIIILSTIIILMGTGYIILLSNNRIKTKENVETISKKEYYSKMLSRMNSYYKIYFRNLNVRSENIAKDIKIPLNNLKSYGFPVEDFLSYDGKEICDLENTYAIRKLEKNKYSIYIYYKCGNDSNYNEPTTKNIKSTQKLESNSN